MIMLANAACGGRGGADRHGANYRSAAIVPPKTVALAMNAFHTIDPFHTIDGFDPIAAFGWQGGCGSFAAAS